MLCHQLEPSYAYTRPWRVNFHARHAILIVCPKTIQIESTSCTGWSVQTNILMKLTKNLSPRGRGWSENNQAQLMQTAVDWWITESSTAAYLYLFVSPSFQTCLVDFNSHIFTPNQYHQLAIQTHRRARCRFRTPCVLFSFLGARASSSSWVIDWCVHQLSLRESAIILSSYSFVEARSKLSFRSHRSQEC
jgi:hypothetical protein